jgi:trk system potassium uptake protein
VKVVIAGGGRVGAGLAARLVTARHSVTVIERDREACDRIFEEVGAVTVCGDATDARSLESAGIGSADVAAGMLARDSENLAFAMLCRARSTARVMVRMLDDQYRDAYRLAGVSDLIAEAEVVVTKITTAIEFPDVGGSIPLHGGDMILFELPISPRALVAGKTVAQVRSDSALPRDCVFIAIVDPDGRTELPSGSTVLRPNHIIVLVARRADLSEAVGYLSAEPEAGGETIEGLSTALRSIDFLAPLNERELADLARGIELVRKTPGEVIFQKGEPGSTFYLVLTGQVALTDETGISVETVQSGKFFGEIALLTGEPRSTSARAVTDCELVIITREDFRRVVMGNPALALEISRILGQRLADAAKAMVAPRKRGLFSR